VRLIVKGKVIDLLPYQDMNSFWQCA